jgi:hypothetical protein
MTIRPQDIPKQLHRPPRWEGWIPTHSGVGFYLTDPKPKYVRLEDIAYGIAYKYRYGGQVAPLTVAEHSFMVAEIIRILWPESNKMLHGLMHDACEAYTQDIQAPIRRFVKFQMPDGQLISWSDLERKINQTIARALKLEPYFYTAPEVRAADILALAVEQSQCDVIKDQKWGLPPIPDEIKHLELNFWPPKTAMQMFLDCYKTLTEG